MASQEVLSALESLHQELNKLEPAIRHVEAAQLVINIAKGIPTLHVELLDEVKGNDSKHKDELKDLFANQIKQICAENDKLIKTTGEIQKQIISEQDSLEKIKTSIQSFHERVEKINFPERLDKVDANISGIMAAIQSVQSRLDLVERNITDGLRDNIDYQKESRGIFIQAIESSNATFLDAINKSVKRNQILGYINWSLIALATIAIIFILKSK